MARPLRLHVPGMPYHAFARGNDKCPIFEDDRDNTRFLEMLCRSLARFSVTCLAYCLMWNHYHLLLVPGELPISRLMQHLNSKYCQWFNRRHRRVGHLLQGRFGGRLIEDASYMLIALRYLALNPVEAQRVARPEDWPWSSHRATIGLAEVPPWLAVDQVWRAFDTADPVTGRERLVAFVSAGLTGDEMESRLLLGGSGLARRVDPLLEPRRNVTDFVYAERFASRPPLCQVLDGVAGRDELEDAARSAFYKHAYTLREIGEALGRPVGTIWSWIKRSERRLEAGSPKIEI